MSSSNFRFGLVLIVSLCIPASESGAEPPSRDAVKAFQELQKKLEDQQEQYLEKRENAEREVRQKLFLETAPANTMVDKFLELEKQNRGTLVGLSCLHHLVAGQIGLSTPNAPVSIGQRKALVILSEHYTEHPDLDLIFDKVNSSLYAGAFHSKETVELLEKSTESPHRHVRGAALYYLAMHLYLKATWPQIRNEIRSLLTEADSKLPEDHHLRRTYDFLAKLKSIDEKIYVHAARERALTVAERVVEKYSDLPLPPSAKRGPVFLKIERTPREKSEDTLGELAEQIQHELTHLCIGQKAPDIERADAFGKPLRLHDHRGKVTVVFFSFEGCGPCEEMYPDNRKLIKEMEGRPFAFLGVMADRDAETSRKAVKSGKITWPVWWGGPDRELSKKWRVYSYPNIFVLDHTGTIRYKSLRWELLGRGVRKLVKEAEAK